MPIYEYRRPDGTTFEVLQKMSEDALTHDPETGEPVTRVLTAPAIHFKGSGFHNTDYGTRKRNREKAAESSSESGSKSSESSGSKDGGGGESKKSDTKPASSSSSSSSSGSSSSD